MIRILRTASVILACITVFVAGVIVMAITTPAGAPGGIAWIVALALVVSIAGAWLREAVDG